MKPNTARIAYCSKCRWLLRAAWLAQEIMSTFEEELGEVTLSKSEAGVFDVYLNGECIWSRKKAGRFPDAKELKQLIRNQIAPDRNLGHSDQ